MKKMNLISAVLLVLIASTVCSNGQAMGFGIIRRNPKVTALVVGGAVVVGALCWYFWPRQSEQSTSDSQENSANQTVSTDSIQQVAEKQSNPFLTELRTAVDGRRAETEVHAIESTGSGKGEPLSDPNAGQSLSERMARLGRKVFN